MVEHLRRNRVAVQNACRDSIGRGRLERGGVVTKIEVTLGTLVNPVDQFAPIAAAKLALFPPFEGFSDRQESAAHLLLMRRRRALTEEAFHSLWDVCHTEVRRPPGFDAASKFLYIGGTRQSWNPAICLAASGSAAWSRTIGNRCRASGRASRRSASTRVQSTASSTSPSSPRRSTFFTRSRSGRDGHRRITLISPGIAWACCSSGERGERDR